MSFQVKGSLSSEQKISLLFYGVFYGFIASLIFHAFCALILKLPYPWNTPLFIGGASHFSDFTLPYTWFQHSLTFTTGNYFAVADIIFWLFGYITLPISLCLYVIIFVAAFLIINKYELREYCGKNFRIFSIGILSFPFLFAIDRGNIELYSYLFLWLFLFFLFKKKWFWTALFLSLSVGMKLYPLIFIILLIKEKRYKEIFFTFIFSVFFIIFIPFIYPIITSTTALTSNTTAITSSTTAATNATANISYALSGFGITQNGYYFSNNNLMQWGTSYFDAIKLLLIKFNGFNIINIGSTHAVFIYFLLCFVIMAEISLYILLIEKSIWKNIMLITAAMIVLPYISCDYKLIYCFLPLYFFFKEKREKSDLIYLILFILILIPKKYYIFQGIETDAVSRACSLMNIFTYWASNNYNVAKTIEFYKQFPSIHFPGLSIDTLLNPIILTIFIVKIQIDGIRQLMLNPKPFRTIKQNFIYYFSNTKHS